ncbi:tRNA pseudouridine synthase D [Geodia barretti]|uniref:tRNA pseudouridine synthase D n=1 Tax=Geodia barretti TaxID=519541 RepID=A0AA35RPR8_GEOBA|nr:tRNA pseudouridine synthase D [Geodia barretti]
MLRGEKVPGGRRLNDFFISALQAHLFNWNLKGRIELGLYNRVFAGDRARRHDTGGMFLVGDPVAAESERAERLEISAVLPLYGRKVSGGLETASATENEVLQRFGLRRSDFRPRTRGDWRISRVKPEDVALRACPDGYTIEFTLPNGAYATTFLRELTKSETDAVVSSAEAVSSE